MSTYANNENGDRINASDGIPHARYKCPNCGEVVHYVSPSRRRIAYDIGKSLYESRIPFFRHSPKSTCALAKTEGAEHRAMKAVWLEAYPDAEEEVSLPSGRRADLVIKGKDGLKRSVECQSSKIEIETVAGRVRDHNSDGLAVAWSFAPARLRNHHLPIYDGVTEALNSSAWRTLNVSRFGQAQSTHVFCDIHHPEEPTMLDVPISLKEANLVEIKHQVRGTTVTVTEDNEELTKEFAKKKRLNYLQLLGRHGQYIDYIERAMRVYGNEDDGRIWRRQFLEICAEEAAKVQISIPVKIKPNKHHITCERPSLKRGDLSLSLPRGPLDMDAEIEEFYAAIYRERGESED
jgi:competence CoiA-like predicted nuclease